MNRDQLPAAVKSKLDALLKAVEKVLNGQKKCPHTRAVIYSWMDTEGAMTGGSLEAPGDPDFDYDAHALRQHFKALLKPSLDVLRGIIVHGSRPNTKEKWQLRTKLISRDEHRALALARKPIDDAVERELRRLAPKSGWEYMSFGRDTPAGKLRLFKRLNGAKPEKLPPDPLFLDLFKRAQDVYRKGDLDLLVGEWTLRPGGLEFNEYYE